MKTVVHLITGTGVGGAERALFNLLNGGLAERYQSYVLSMGGVGEIGEQIAALGVPVIPLGFDRLGGALRSTLASARLMRHLQPDLIQGWMYHGNVAATVLSKAVWPRPAVMWNVRHCLYDLRDERRSTRQVIRVGGLLSAQADGLLYNSQLARVQHEAFGYASARAEVIPNGIDTARFCPQPAARRRIRAALALSPQSTLIGHVGRYHPMKDHRCFVQAAVRLAQSDEHAHFVMIGAGVDRDNGPLCALIPDELLCRFHLMGLQTNVSEWMAAMDIFCQSSFSEAFPNVLGEAMATGLYCVATDVGDSALIVGPHGALVPPRDPVALAAALAVKVDRAAIGACARRRVLSHFTLNAIVQRYAQSYERLLRTPSI